MDPKETGRRIRALRLARDYTQPRLSRAMYDADTERDEHGDYDTSFISKVETGKKPAPQPFLELAARVLQPTPEELPDYHLARVQRLFSEDEVDRDQALANLEAFNALLAVDGDVVSVRAEPLPHPGLPGELGRRPSDPQRDAERPPQRQTPRAAGKKRGAGK